MREQICSTLFLLLLQPTAAQSPATAWTVVKDSKSRCQIMVPPEWVPLAENTGAAVFQDATTAIAVVTSQPGQTFRPLTESLKKVLGIRKETMFENTAKRIFYQDKISNSSEDPNAYSASVAGRDGTCSLPGGFCYPHS
jgi:hypothetical protein